MSIEVTRRQLFMSALGFPALAAAAVTDPLSAKKPHFAGDGKVRHLPVHAWRAEPPGDVRSQASI